MSLEQAKAQIDRDNCIANNIDALGKKWVIKHIQHTTLYTVRPDPDREDAQIPTVFQGKYTHPERAQNQLNLHLNRSWDKAETAQAKSAPRPVVETDSKSVDVGLVASSEATPEEVEFVKEMVTEKDAAETDAKELLPTESGA
jgi:hypothetical protein